MATNQRDFRAKNGTKYSIYNFIYFVYKYKNENKLIVTVFCIIKATRLVSFTRIDFKV